MCSSLPMGTAKVSTLRIERRLPLKSMNCKAGPPTSRLSTGLWRLNGDMRECECRISLGKSGACATDLQNRRRISKSGVCATDLQNRQPLLCASSRIRQVAVKPACERCYESDGRGHERTVRPQAGRRTDCDGVRPLEAGPALKGQRVFAERRIETCQETAGKQGFFLG